MADEDVELVQAEAKEAMDKSVAGLRHELTKVRTSRANPVLLDGITVDYYGTPTPLKKLATIGAPEARLLVVQPFDPGALSDIEKAIIKADIGLMPSNDGTMVRVPIPELTGERRRELVKQIKKFGEEHKVGVRSARRDAIAMLKDMQKEGEISEDELKTGQKKIQEATDAASAEIEQAIDAKEEEILRI